MRRLMRALVLLAAVAVVAVPMSGCGSSGARAKARPDKPRHLFSLAGFDLRPGHPCRVNFTMDGTTLHFIAYVRGRGPIPGADPALRCRLERVNGSRLVPVALKADQQFGSRYWTHGAGDGATRRQAATG